MAEQLAPGGWRVNQRIGCARCDGVFRLSPPRMIEAELHTLQCPRCGAYAVHGYSVPGTWPSDYDGQCPELYVPA